MAKNEVIARRGNMAMVDERMAKVEGNLEQVLVRLDRVESDLRNKADKWEIRIWFMLVITLSGVILSRFLAL